MSGGFNYQIYNDYANTYKIAMDELPNAFNNLSQAVTKVGSDMSALSIPNDHLGDKVRESIDKIKKELEKTNEDVATMRDSSIGFAKERYEHYKYIYERLLPTSQESEGK